MGCSLLLNYRSSSSTKGTSELCDHLSSTYGVCCYAVQADLSDPVTAAEKIVSSAKKYFSDDNDGLTIDILVNNAGIAKARLLADPVRGPIDPDMFNDIFTVNVVAPTLLTQAVVPHLPCNRSGRIVNVSSVSPELGLQASTVYAGSKGALEAMTRVWARELSERATVNSINPGPTFGDMYSEAGKELYEIFQPWQDGTPGSNPTKAAEERMSEEERNLVREEMGGRRPAFGDEVAGIVGMLCTKDAEWCTGSVVCANGGMKMGV